jgi:hypothetical protein
MGNDVSFSEIRHSMTILVGAFSNGWTQELTGQLRFAFGMNNGVKYIRDRSRSGITWKPPFMPPNGKVSEDYAIIMRLFLSESGQTLVAVAGITQYGNQAGGEGAEHATRDQDECPGCDDDASRGCGAVFLVRVRAESGGASITSGFLRASH